MKAIFSFGRLVLSISSITAVLLLTACSDTSTSSSGGGSSFGKATIAGNVQSGVASLEQSGTDSGLLVKALELSISEAFAAGVSGVTVILLKDGSQVADTVTDGSGNFVFSNLEPGNYSIQVGGATTESFLVPGNSKTNLVVNLDGVMLELEVETEGNRISGEVEDEISSDDDSEDDVSEDDESEDDESEDDESEDDESEDENNNN